MDEFDRRAHADALGHRRRLAHQQLRHRQRIDLADIDRLAVMLADIGVAKAELVGQHDLGEVLFVGLGCGGVGTKTIRKNSEFHSNRPVIPSERGGVGGVLHPFCGLTTPGRGPRFSAMVGRRREARMSSPAHLRHRPHSRLPGVVGGERARARLRALADPDRRCRGAGAGIPGHQPQRPVAGHRRRRLCAVRVAGNHALSRQEARRRKALSATPQGEAGAWQWSFGPSPRSIAASTSGRCTPCACRPASAMQPCATRR